MPPVTSSHASSPFFKARDDVCAESPFIYSKWNILDIFRLIHMSVPFPHHLSSIQNRAWQKTNQNVRYTLIYYFEMLLNAGGLNYKIVQYSSLLLHVQSTCKARAHNVQELWRRKGAKIQGANRGAGWGTEWCSHSLKIPRPRPYREAGRMTSLVWSI